MCKKNKKKDNKKGLKKLVKGSDFIFGPYASQEDELQRFDSDFDWKNNQLSFDWEDEFGHTKENLEDTLSEDLEKWDSEEDYKEGWVEDENVDEGYYVDVPEQREGCPEKITYTYTTDETSSPEVETLREVLESTADTLNNETLEGLARLKTRVRKAQRVLDDLVREINEISEDVEETAICAADAALPL